MAGIYIHIPFCKQACSYCNFYFSTSLSNKERFLESLHREIALSKDYLDQEKIETIYFGGGTPSLLSHLEMASIIREIERHHDISSLQEFTIEANPDDLSLAKIKEFGSLKSLGLNRFSIGVQSFFDEDLDYMNRVHNSEEALSSIRRVQDAGFENITIDLIYGTPTLNDERWHQNLEKTFDLNIPHISSYALTVEAKTTLENKIKKGIATPVDEEQSARQFQTLMEEMRKAGYEQYEISNFAKDKKYAVHNSNYWFGKKYLGLGPSAHSFNEMSRQWNIPNNIQYINSIRNGKIPHELELLTEAQKVNEHIMTSLRTIWGLNISGFEFVSKEHQSAITDSIRQEIKKLDASLYSLNNSILTLTDAGKLFADKIAASLFIS
ncbi:MAG: radical SAM family heme chaperone HemW [Bacteroidetes bacterium]|nr:radical SAM family heme chaperone HemW [Bacteroidota bacterium]